jgi:hypothetical protein
MSEGPARAGASSRGGSPSSLPSTSPSPSPAPEGAADEGADALEKAYVAPQVLPKAALPTTPEPDAKVVLNLPSNAVGAVSEEEVRAARARRRTATVKIDRAAVAETLGPEAAAAAASGLAAPTRAHRGGAAPATMGAPLLPDADDATPVDRHRQLRPRAVAPAAVVTSREVEPSLDAAYTPPKSRSGLLVAVGAVAVLGVGAWLVAAGGAGPAITSPELGAPTARAPAAEQARPTNTPAPPATPPPTEVALPTKAASPSTTAPARAAETASAQAAASHPAAPVSTAAAKAPAAPPRPAAKPITRPAKPKGDIPSEI